jgi:Saccharopine dehydrogenase C-terminal domain
VNFKSLAFRPFIDHLSSLVARVKAICQFGSDAESTRIISGLRWIGLFSGAIVKPRAGNLLDTLCAQLEVLMQYEPGERDLVMLQHKFVIEWQDGKEVCFLTSACLGLVTDNTPSGDSDIDARAVWNS